MVNRFLVRFTLQVSALFAMISFSIPITLHSPFCTTIFYAIAMIREVFRAEYKKINASINSDSEKRCIPSLFFQFSFPILTYSSFQLNVYRNLDNFYKFLCCPILAGWVDPCIPYIWDYFRRTYFWIKLTF